MPWRQRCSSVVVGAAFATNWVIVHASCRSLVTGDVVCGQQNCRIGGAGESGRGSVAIELDEAPAPALKHDLRARRVSMVRVY